MPQTVQAAPVQRRQPHGTRLESFGAALLLAGAVLLVVGWKFRQIGFFASDVPRGDPWDGVAGAVLLPYLKGTLSWSDFFAAHNEHRVVFTRLESLVLLLANGQWDMRLEITVNVGVQAAAFVVLLLALRAVMGGSRLVLAAGLGALLFGSTVSWENTLSGFQSQFYYLLLFSFVHLAGSLLAPAGSKRWWAGQVAGLLNLFTMAGGVFSAFAVLGTTAYLWVFCRRRTRDLALLAGWNAALIVLGLLLLPRGVPAPAGSVLDGALRLRALDHIAAWPLEPVGLGLFVQAPLIVYLAFRLARPSDDPRSRLLLGLSLLAWIHIAVLAFSRGGMASRYVDLAALGLVANALVWWELPASGRLREVQLFAGGAWLAFILAGLWSQEWTSENAILRVQDARDQSRAVAIREFLRSGEREVLARAEDVTETDAGVLAAMLRRPEVRRVLPPGIRPGLPLLPEVVSPGVFAAPGAPDLANRPRGLATVGTWSASGGGTEGRFLSGPFESGAAVLTLWFSGRLAPGETELHLVRPDGGRVPPLADRIEASNRWIRLNFPNPGGTLRLEAVDQSRTAWMAFSEPVEVPRLAWWAGKGLKTSGLLRGLGVILFLAGSVIVLRGEWVGAEQAG